MSDDGTQDSAELYTIRPDGTGRRQLTHNSMRDEGPSWSPNGKRIAFAAFDGHDYEIFTIKADGGDRRQLTHNRTDDINPSWGVRVPCDFRDTSLTAPIVGVSDAG